MFRRQKTRNSNIVYKCSTVAFVLAFSHCLSSLQKEMGEKTFPFLRAREALAGEKRAKMLGKSDRQRKLQDT
jgi:hypothetical protein